MNKIELEAEDLIDDPKKYKKKVKEAVKIL